ncbi:MAG TPA: hypothetical protein VMF06_24250 [Candidatus Limnocylindria bacterium]|jgi:hypothetical protein|nr:hypothetical protein [Candidatus Limnocylindria bacterium]
MSDRCLKIVLIDDEFPIADNKVSTLLARNGATGQQALWQVGSVITAPQQLLTHYVDCLLYCGHDLYCIKDAETAIDFFKSEARHEIDVAVLDIMIPPGRVKFDPKGVCSTLMYWCLVYQAGFGRRRTLPIAILTNVSDNNIFAELRQNYLLYRKEFPQICAPEIWIESKAKLARAWVANLETWIATGKRNSGF